MSIFRRVSELKPFAIGGNTGEIYDFIIALQKAIRGVKFGVIDGREHREIHVYTEGQPFTMGYIGYGDWRDSVVENID